MKKNKINIALITVCLISLQWASAKPKLTKDDPNPYTKTGVIKPLAEYVPIKINPSNINVISGDLATIDKNLRLVERNYMSLWLENKKAGQAQIEWIIDSPTSEVYDITAIVLGNGSQITLKCNGQQLEARVSGKVWDRPNLGTVKLNAGKNILQLSVDAKTGFQIDAIELVQPEVKVALLEEALKMRQDPVWLKEAGYGLMFQWTNRATPPKGSIKAWEDKVNDFDLEGFINTVEASGAAYVVWSITWGQQYISAPVQSLDQIIQGRTSKRDLLSEMADALYKRGIKLIFYYHYGYNCYHSIDKDWMNASGGYKGDKSELYQNMMNIFSELGARYGKKLNGWWFDGGQRYYNSHFDGSSPSEGILSAPFKEMTIAARTGNSARIVSYNSWVKPRLTEFQDYYGGEGKKTFLPDELTNGVFNRGRQKGLQAHGCFIFERRWGHIGLNDPITKSRFTIEKLSSMVKAAMENRYALSINLEIYEDGSVSPNSLKLLKELKKEIRGN